MIWTSFADLWVIPSGSAEMATLIGSGQHLSSWLWKETVHGFVYLGQSPSWLYCPSTHCSGLSLLYLTISDRWRFLLAFRFLRSRFHNPPLVTHCNISQLSAAVCSAFPCGPDLSYRKLSPWSFAYLQWRCGIDGPISTQQHNLKVLVSNRILHGCFTLIMELSILQRHFIFLPGL